MTPAKVFLLWHVHEMADGEEDAKLIGVYSTRGKAEAARVRSVLQPGFREHPDGFIIDPYEVDEDHWREGYDNWLPTSAADGPNLLSCRNKIKAEELNSQITPENVHPEVDWGPAVGREILPPYEGKEG